VKGWKNFALRSQLSARRINILFYGSVRIRCAGHFSLPPGDSVRSVTNPGPGSTFTPVRLSLLFCQVVTLHCQRVARIFYHHSGKKCLEMLRMCLSFGLSF
jgi:hypothetical protein